MASKPIVNLALPVPFGESDELFTGQHVAQIDTSQIQHDGASKPRLMLPAVFETKEKWLRVIRPVESNIQTFWAQELDVARLNCLHKHLWFAGLPQPPRPLHNQIQVERAFRITEKLDMHLLWKGQIMYLKPLPTYLLCHDTWAHHLCKDLKLYRTAIGFLLSYVYLIVNPSDFKIALDQGLMDPRVTWDDWVSLVKALSDSGATNWDVNPRFHFGELRLDRVNWAYRFCAVARRDGHSMIRGYFYMYHDYSTFLEKNLAWLVTASVYIGLVLTAMQVGLATEELQGNSAFQKASWGFTVLVILGPLIIIGVLVLFVLLLIIKNATFERSKKGKPGVDHPVWQDIALNQYQH